MGLTRDGRVEADGTGGLFVSFTVTSVTYRGSFMRGVSPSIL